MKGLRRGLFVGLLLALSVWPVGLCADDAKISFRKEIAPLLLEHCVSCHGPKKAEGGYRVDSFAQLSRAGDSGIAPLEVPAQSQMSELLRRVTTSQESERMPAERETLGKDLVSRIERWQKSGFAFDATDPLTPLFELVPAEQYTQAPSRYSVPLPIVAVAFSDDGTHIVSGGYHELLVWNLEGGLVKRIGNMPERISSLDWSPDGQRLAVSGGAPGRIGEVRVIDWATSQVTLTFGRAQDMVAVVRYQPGGSQVATGNTDGTLRWFDASDGRVVRSIAAHADSVNAIAWSADGKRLASASRDKTSKVFEVDSGELLSTYSAHGDSVTGIGFVEGGKEICSVGADKKIHRWQVEDAKSLAKLDLPAAATRMQIDGSRGWLCLTDRSLRSFEMASAKLVSNVEGHRSWPACVAVHAPSKRIVVGSLLGDLYLRNLDDGSLIREWNITSVGVQSQSRPD